MNEKRKVPSLKVIDKIDKALKKRAFFLSSGKSKGSMALEGSLVLPIFLFFMMTVLLSLEAVRFQSNVQEALHQEGNRSAFEGYRMKYQGKAGGDAVKRAKEYLNNQLFPYLCIAGGREGVIIKDLSAVEQNGRIEITAEYGLKPFINWLPIGEIKVMDRFVSHAWIGYSGGKGQSGGQEIYVYVTETGSRYHLSYHCTYLGVRIQAVDYRQLDLLRNQNGGKYYACRRCRPAGGGIVYITEDGGSYHGMSDCSALKRTVYMIPLSEAGNRSACSKCAG
ncbi:MAG: hypothetical protein NC400_06345 [Clostridium sp.]|nr:hypothetical protein [Clostridium sp.]